MGKSYAHDHASVEWVRFTPTCVGKLSAKPGTASGTTGSPPRVWGNLERLTPEVTRAVHPHVCGEIVNEIDDRLYAFRFTPTCVGKLTQVIPWSSGMCGSPPRVWGNCTIVRDRCWHMTVHPHVCGEICGYRGLTAIVARFTPTCVGKSSPGIPAMTCPSGSPPRVWGNARAIAHRLHVRSVHPHVCGEIGASPS